MGRPTWIFVVHWLCDMNMCKTVHVSYFFFIFFCLCNSLLKWYLTVTTPWANSVDDKTDDIFSYFFQKIDPWHFMQIVS